MDIVVGGGMYDTHSYTLWTFKNIRLIAAQLNIRWCACSFEYKYAILYILVST